MSPADASSGESGSAGLRPSMSLIVILFSRSRSGAQPAACRGVATQPMDLIWPSSSRVRSSFRSSGVLARSSAINGAARYDIPKTRCSKATLLWRSIRSEGRRRRRSVSSRLASSQRGGKRWKLEETTPVIFFVNTMVSDRRAGKQWSRQEEDSN